MLSLLEKKLQPLRIPPGWCVGYGIFFEVDPTPETMDWFYGSVMFAARDQRAKLDIELTFEPEGDPDGAYVLRFYRYFGRGDSSNATMLSQLVSKSRLEVVAEIERFMDERTAIDPHDSEKRRV